MTQSHNYSPARATWPHWYRLIIITLGALILCACRTPRNFSGGGPAQHGAPMPPAAVMGADSGIPLEAMAAGGPMNGMPMHGAMPPGMMMETPLAMGQPPEMQETPGPWQPSGIAPPWPMDEYLCDGGDRGLRARVGADWRVFGLEQEDTIAHYDTLDGGLHVEPSSKVCLYAPRFAAVRSVIALEASDQVLQPKPMHGPQQLIVAEEQRLASTTLQQLPPVIQVGTKSLTTLKQGQGEGAISTAIKPVEFEQGFLPHENLSIVRFGIMKQADAARLAIGRNAAITWSHDLATIALVQGQKPTESTGDRRAQAVMVYDTPKGPAKLRLVKLASTDAANPGETVDFTIRYDNVGFQVLGNVTVIDNLTTRLELVPGSMQCSVPAEFFTEVNEHGSLVIRCEVTDPVPSNQGGIIRFQCLVR